MLLDKKKIKEKLEKERDILVEEMRGMGQMNTDTKEWEATPEVLSYKESDQNDMADRFEDFESKSSMIKILEERYNNILKAIKNLNKDSFGKCKICKKEIEMARIEANPAATTCKKHLKD